MRCFIALVIAWAAAFPQAHGQDAAVPKVVQLPGGVEVRLKSSSTGLDKVADVLEAYAKQLRAASKTQAVEARIADESPSTPLSTAGPVSKTLPAGTPHNAAKGADGYPKILFPSTLLWQPPYANHNEPHTYVKRTSLEELGMTPVDDVAVGGTFPLFRLASNDRPDNGWQFDLFAMIASRFIVQNYLMATDYRFGVPITFAYGRWSGKIAFEHTSTHVGDEYTEKTGRTNRSSIRDEIVFGLAYRVLEPLRVHATVGLNFNEHESFRKGTGSYRDRYSFGAEWSRPLATGAKGQPFAAIDLEYRGDLDYTPNFSAQAGWQWLVDGARPGVRLVAEFYDGRNPFGQFLDRHENRISAALYYDF